MTRLTVVLLIVLGTVRPVGADQSAAIQAALDRAGDNRPEIERALASVSAKHATGLQFLVAHMPDRDLTTLTADFLLENVEIGYAAWTESPWKDAVPESIFLNNILPYANVNENRDRWRKQFRDQFLPLVAEAKTPAMAAALLNQKVFPLLKVRYSTKRRRADQGPNESIKSGLASCTGLSILLIDACRSVGVPARFVGTPLWTNKSGNHSWVEVWDDGWHFTGAAEPTGNDLDRGWFVGRAATAQRDHPLHAIYAVSFKKTPQHFPLVWDRSINYISAVNVTDRYTNRAPKIPDGHVEVQFRALDEVTGDRCAAGLRIFDANGKLVFRTVTKDERFDANDHVGTPLKQDATYRVEFEKDGRVVKRTIRAIEQNKPISVKIDSQPPKKE